MIHFNERSIFSLFLFLFTSVMLLTSLDLKGDVILVPRIMGAILLLFSGVQLMIDCIPAVRKRLHFLHKNTDGERDKTEAVGQEYLFLGWMVLFVTLIFLSSMILATAISIFIYLKWISKESWKLSLLYSTIFAGAIYVTFVVGMGVHYFI